MTDIATLGLRVQADGARQATAQLNDLSASAKNAELMAEAMGLATTKADKSLQGISQTTTRVQASISQMVGGLDRASKSARDSALAFAEIDQSRTAFESLQASIDPLYASSMRYQQAVETTQRAVAQGVITQQRANAVLEKAEAAYLGAGAAMRGSAAMAGAASSQFNLAAGSVGNLTAQFNDIGVMLAAGQSPLQLAIQQGTQISQVFGNASAGAAVRSLGAAFRGLVSPVNLITIGTIAAGAAIFQFARNAMGAAEDAREAGEGVEEFTDALEAYQNYADTAQASTADLREEFGQFANEVRENAEYLARITASQAIGNLDTSDFTIGLQTAIDQIERFRATASDTSDELGSQSVLAQMRQDAVEAAGDLGLTIDQVETLQGAFAAIDGETTMAGVSQAAQEALETIRAMTENSVRLPEPMREVVEMLTRVQSTAAAAATTMGDVENGAMQVAVGMGEAQSEALEMLASLREEVREREAINAYVLEGASLSEARAMAERDVFAATLETKGIAGEMADELLRAYDAAKGIGDLGTPGWLASATQEARVLAQTLGVALSVAKEIRFERQTKEYSGRGGDPRQFDTEGRLGDVFVPTQDVANRADELLRDVGSGGRSRRRSGGGGRGGKSEAEKAAEKLKRENEQEAARVLREVERSTLDAMSATERYAYEVGELQKLEEQGYLTTEQFARARQMLGDQLAVEQFEPIKEQIESLSDAMADAIVNGEDMGEALARVFQQLASDLISSGLTNLATSAFGPASSGSGLFASIAGMFGGGMSAGAQSGSAIAGLLNDTIAGARANGGPVRADEPYLVNENTPRSEVFVPSRSGGVLNVPQAQEALRGSGGSQKVEADVRVYVDDDGNLQAMVERVSNRSAQAAASSAVRDYDKRVMPQRFGSNGAMRDPRRRG